MHVVWHVTCYKHACNMLYACSNMLHTYLDVTVLETYHFPLAVEWPYLNLNHLLSGLAFHFPLCLL